MGRGQAASQRVVFRLTPRAQADIEDIRTDTHRRWSIDQAERCVGQIRDAIIAVARDGRLGRSCDEVGAGYRRRPPLPLRKAG